MFYEILRICVTKEPQYDICNVALRDGTVFILTVDHGSSTEIRKYIAQSLLPQSASIVDGQVVMVRDRDGSNITRYLLDEFTRCMHVLWRIYQIAKRVGFNESLHLEERSTDNHSIYHDYLDGSSVRTAHCWANRGVKSYGDWTPELESLARAVGILRSPEVKPERSEMAILMQG